ncbi:NAD(P)H-dependent oxidoreductase subunit E [Undibacterium cyanobacteriorum]|uniref:NAD(P)H-dependent oxidoreductase subunit E n=1 Tax=Undibacterium cyanobacteriorum TaxID=3073561 RepID=A0ABY9RKF8_9BURK|nr:NAD(P)H-dependent oxidoreductase subunit E [Undibacterium sp. 20NA77.5]WMW81328.1 NAD(P)H-dependent oxidoreductase subunit E [Undibacterium sp. 20NA77.5]
MSDTQPGQTANAIDLASIQELINANKNQAGALLPILHAIQDKLGFIPEHVVPLIARALNLSRAEVHGVITFYHHFKQAAPKPHTLQICRAEACQSMGAEALWDKVCQHRAVRSQELDVEAVYCLGLCSTAPAALLDGRLQARLTENKLNDLLNQLPAQSDTKGNA